MRSPGIDHRDISAIYRNHRLASNEVAVKLGYKFERFDVSTWGFRVSHRLKSNYPKKTIGIKLKEPDSYLYLKSDLKDTSFLRTCTAREYGEEAEKEIKRRGGEASKRYPITYKSEIE